MRSTLLRIALVAIAFAAGPAAFAQFGFRPKVKIDNPRVGFRPAGGNERADGGLPQFVSKSGMWAPVSFTLEMLGDTDRGMRVEVSTNDGDGFRTVLTVPVARKRDTKAGEPPRVAGERIEPTEFVQSVYARVSGMAESVKLQIRSDDDDNVSLSDPIQVESIRPRTTSAYVVLSLGASVPGFSFKPPANHPAGVPYLNNGRVELAKIESVQEMPDQWFGYDGADLVVIGTGRADKQFVADLFAGNTATANKKRWALFEWVRRGGNLLLSVGEKADEVRASKAFDEVLPVSVGQATRVPVLKSKQFGTSQFEALNLKFAAKKPGEPADPFPVAALTARAGRQPTTLLTDDTGKRTLVAQSPLGLGRITVVGFDLDRSPFADDQQRYDFWEWLVRASGGGRAIEQPAKQKNKNDTNYSGFTGPVEDGAATAIRSNIDSFEGVPVISFGWVALFILGYTLLIGPVEYIFLKKVLGRLELTWVTFPLIVLTVSAAAYFTAYAVKGKDLRVNKIDVIDIDPRDEGRVYGRTWFTIFSPRIDSYAVGVQAKDNWAVPPPTGPNPATLVDWFGGTGSGGLGGSARTYQYKFDPLTDEGRPTGPANGLVGVPIQVWSTKAFTANWSALPAGPLPPVVSTVTRLPAGDDVGGTLTVNLPLKLVEKAYVVYRKRVYELDSGIATGLPVRINTAATPLSNDQLPFQADSRFQASDSGSEFGFGGPGVRRGRGYTQQATPTAAGELGLWGLLFHEEAMKGLELQNSTLRGLDQSWRLSEKNDGELILLIKLKRETGTAELMMTAPESACPTQLWLTALPGSGPRAAVPGLLQQDTYIRVFVPVKPAGAK